MCYWHHKCDAHVFELSVGTKNEHRTKHKKENKKEK